MFTVKNKRNRIGTHANKYRKIKTYLDIGMKLDYNDFI